MEAPQNLKIEVPHDPAVPLLGIYLKEYKSSYYKSNYTCMLIAPLFTIAKLWKQPRFSTTDAVINKMYLYTMELYSATKKDFFFVVFR
jgi:hypothetical protein